MLWVYAQLCSYHLATGRNERRRRGRGRRVSQPIDSFREKDKRAYLESPFPFSHCVNEIKEEPRAFRPMQKPGVEGGRGVANAKPTKLIGLSLPHSAHLTGTRLFVAWAKIPCPAPESSSCLATRHFTRLQFSQN